MAPRAILVALAMVAAGGRLAAQQLPANTYCVVPRDTSWRPSYFGFDTENEFLRARTLHNSYPILRNIVPASPADSAGLRDGDELIAIDGRDLAKPSDSAHVRGPGFATRLKIRRADTTFERTITPTAAKPCRR